MTKHPCVIFCICIIAPILTYANSTKACHLITASSERLACYDALSAQNSDMTDMQKRIRLAKESQSNPFSLTPYRPNYLLPLSYNSSPNAAPFEQIINPGEEIDKLESKFQISFQFDLRNNIFDSNSDLYFAYTQQAFWQVYNTDASSPFRETNYEPELGIKFTPNYEIFGFNNSQIRLGLVHQSNGRAVPLSRSWNRLFALFIFDKGDFVTALRPWVRLHESTVDDDNPDIDDFMGNFEWYGFYKQQKSVFGFMLRNNLKSESNRGAIQLDWSYPISDRLKWYAQYFNGYGESLVDYNDKSERISAGISLTDWL